MSRSRFPSFDLAAKLLLLASLLPTRAAPGTSPAPSAPLRPNAPIGQFEPLGDGLVSAQQMFLGTEDHVYLVDKTENNPHKINGHPAWASEWSLSGSSARAMDVVTNSFCAGGNVLGNGTWMNVGGNQAVTWGGLTAPSQNGGGPYDDPDGGKSVRFLDPCDDQSCEWVLGDDMSTRRWYPTLETLEDGSMIIIGGCNWGGFVNDAAQTNPTYEFFPPLDDPTPITSPFLQNTLPVNLYPITFLTPGGKLLMQAEFKTIMLDYNTHQEFKLSAMPHAVRTYPASAGTAMLPLTPQNNWTATIAFCGGSNIPSNKWTTNWDIATFEASNSCVRITPDVSGDYEEDDPLPQGRSMGNMIILPTGEIVYLNGAATGVAGYGNDSWAVGESYADNAILQPLLYTPSAPSGQRWSDGGFGASTIPRMYHSSATLTPDGSILVGGSNPNSDVNLNVKFPTEYRLERLYPSYYNSRRPQPSGIPSTLTYGGAFFDINLTADDLFGDVHNVENATVVIMRTGFSTHTMNMGQRMVVLESSYTGNLDGSAVIHSSQLPPNPAILVPGPALAFIVVNGVPSIGVQVMVGSGQIGTQKVQDVQALPQSKILTSTANSGSQTGGGSAQHTGGPNANAATSLRTASSNAWIDLVLLPAVLAGLFALNPLL